MLHNLPEELNAKLSQSLFPNDPGLGLLEEIEGTGRLLGIEPTFWNLVQADIPWQLTEGARSSLLDSDLVLNPVLKKADEQILGQHTRYSEAVLVRDLFQCFHREDGRFIT